MTILSIVLGIGYGNQSIQNSDSHDTINMVQATNSTLEQANSSLESALATLQASTVVVPTIKTVTVPTTVTIAASSSAVTTPVGEYMFDCAALKAQTPTARNCGIVKIAYSHPIDLDSKAADWGTNSLLNGESNLFFTGSGLTAQADGKNLGIAKLSSTTLPSRETCADPLLSYEPEVNLVNLDAGTFLCAKTLQARFSGISMFKDWDAQSETIDLSVVTWENQ